ncbi:MAG: SRPBCC domain-containing protein [Planctomycetia bacterium]|nr:SRPBCC domain-containing protein [Planctomycetia bacterium]
MRRVRRFAVVVVAALLLAQRHDAHADRPPTPPPPVVISAPRADVFAAMTTVEGIVATDGGAAIVDLRTGGTIRRHRDREARPDAAGWTTQRVLAVVAPRLLVVEGPAADETTVVELDALDAVRTRLRFEHVRPAGATGPDEGDQALVSRLRRRFPDRPDPLLAVATPWAGAWRAAPGSDASEARLAIEITATTVVVRLEGTAFDGHWGFTRDPVTARWAGVALDGPPVAWRVEADAGGLRFGDDHADIPTDLGLVPDDDGGLRLEGVEGCLGVPPVRFVRVAAAK